MRHFFYLAALLAISTSAPAVMKCSGRDGKTWYQDQPCLPGASAVQLQGSGFSPPVYPQDSVQPIVVQPVEQPTVEQQPVTVGTIERFQWLEIREQA